MNPEKFGHHYVITQLAIYKLYIFFNTPNTIIAMDKKCHSSMFFLFYFNILCTVCLCVCKSVQCLLFWVKRTGDFLFLYLYINICVCVVCTKGNCVYIIGQKIVVCHGPFFVCYSIKYCLLCT